MGNTVKQAIVQEREFNQNQIAETFALFNPDGTPYSGGGSGVEAIPGIDFIMEDEFDGNGDVTWINWVTAGGNAGTQKSTVGNNVLSIVHQGAAAGKFTTDHAVNYELKAGECAETSMNLFNSWGDFYNMCAFGIAESGSGSGDYAVGMFYDTTDQRCAIQDKANTPWSKDQPVRWPKVKMRVCRINATTLRYQISGNGVDWLPFKGQSDLTISYTPTYLFLAGSAWGSGHDNLNVFFDYFRVYEF